MTPAFGEAQADRMPPGRPTGSAVSSAPSAEQALRFAQALARACARALGGNVAGVILHGPSSGVRVEERRHPGERDLAVELSVCRAHGPSLLGAAPAELLGEVPDRWVVAAGDAQLAAWRAIGDDPKHAELTVLTACRVWRFAEEGRHASKAAAAQWALGRDPTLGVVGDALRRRRGDPAARIDPAQVAWLLAVVRARLTDAGDRAAGGEDRRAPG
jgi:Domain of unknown function (DUF4111)